MGLFTQEDLIESASRSPQHLRPVLLFEHRWAVDIKDAMVEAGGFLVARETVIPPEVIEEVSEELEANGRDAPPRSD